MKALLLIAGLLIMAQGCVYTNAKITLPNGGVCEIDRSAYFYPFKTGGIEIPGFVTLLDYNTDGGGATAAAVTGAAVKAAIEGAK